MTRRNWLWQTAALTGGAAATRARAEEVPCLGTLPATEKLLASYTLWPQSNSGLRQVYTYGRGPAIIILHELPGLSPEDLAYGLRVADRGGFTVYLPLLFGGAGQNSAALGSLQACLSGKFACCSPSKTSRITGSLRTLCRAVSIQHHGAGIGVIGLCLTGSLPLALLTEPCVKAVVCCEPSLPLLGHKSDLGISRDESKAAQNRVDVPILVYRFRNDTISTHERFEAIRKLVGSRFGGSELPNVEQHSAKSHADHAVMTHSYSDCENSPTRRAFDAVISYLRLQLISPNT